MCRLIWILLPAPECCVCFIDICGSVRRPAAGAWCRFSRKSSLGDCSYWGQNCKLNDGLFSTSSGPLWSRITLRPHFTPLVCKLGVVKKKEKKRKKGETHRASRPLWSRHLSGTLKAPGDLKGASMSVSRELRWCQKCVCVGGGGEAGGKRSQIVTDCRTSTLCPQAKKMDFRDEGASHSLIDAGPGSG